MEETRMTLGHRIRAWRESQGLDRLEFAVRVRRANPAVNCKEHDLWRWESGYNEPGITALMAMAEALGITLDQLTRSAPETALVGSEDAAE
jgi:transcriptional regulator with XRE-family HTH domain